MTRLIQYASCLWLVVATACIREGTYGLTTETDETMTVSFTLTVGHAERPTTRVGGDLWSHAYTAEDTDYDRVVDPATVRAYIYDSEGGYVACVTCRNCYRMSYDTYRYLGTLDKAPFVGRNGSVYRCVVTANTVGEGVDEAETFGITSVVGRRAEQLYYIPMWGVGSFRLNESVEAQMVEAISLLRAAVKWRVALSDDLAERYEIVGVQQLAYMPRGYVWPAAALRVDQTGALAYRQGTEGALYCFRPLSTDYVSGPIDFAPDPDAEGHPEGWISYSPELQTVGSAACLSVLIRRRGADAGSAVAYPCYLSQLSEVYPDLVRNHVYNLTVESLGGSMLTLSASVSEWSEVAEVLDYTETLAVGGDIEWEGCNSADNKTLEVNHNVASTGMFRILSPLGNAWYAVLDEHAYFSFVVQDEVGGATTYSTQVSGVVDGAPHSIVVQATNVSSDTQPRATLDFYVQIGYKFVRLESLSGWNIVLSK